MYLLDTNVVSEVRRPRPDRRVLKWIGETPADRLFVAAITVGEIQAGIEIMRERNAEKADEFSHWIETVIADYNVIPMGAADFREWARLKHRKPAGLHQDAMIAAMAKVRRMTVATRNVRDFRMFEINLYNPFESP